MEEVKKYSTINNKFSKDYKNKFIKMIIWKAIGENFGLDAAEAENKTRMSELRMGDTWEKIGMFPLIVAWCCPISSRV